MTRWFSDTSSPASLCSQTCDHGAQAPKIKAAGSWALGLPTRGAVSPRKQLQRWDLLLLS